MSLSEDEMSADEDEDEMTSNEEASELIERTIHENKVVIFSKTTCQPCKNTKNLFNELGQLFVDIDLEKRSDANDIFAELKKITGINTVPKVFINGKYVGGSSHVKLLNETGELERLLVNKKI